MQNSKPERVTIAEILTHHTHMSHYQFQRWVFRVAARHGWNGREPSVLGNYFANREFDRALRFLQSTSTTEPADEPQ